MSSRNYSDQEYDKLQRFKYENKRLKKQLSRLRKQMSRIDLDRYTNLKELIEKHDREDRDVKLAQDELKIRKLWECWECRQGVLIFIPIIKKTGEFYFRRCNNCGHRTKTQKFNEKVKKGPPSKKVKV